MMNESTEQLDHEASDHHPLIGQSHAPVNKRYDHQEWQIFEPIEITLKGTSTIGCGSSTAGWGSSTTGSGS